MLFGRPLAGRREDFLSARWLARAQARRGIQQYNRQSKGAHAHGAILAEVRTFGRYF
jgi:hypothetical protein